MTTNGALPYYGRRRINGNARAVQRFGAGTATIALFAAPAPSSAQPAPVSAADEGQLQAAINTCASGSACAIEVTANIAITSILIINGKNLAISSAKADGSRAELDGQNAVQMVNVDSASTVTISGIDFKRGNAGDYGGGAINNAGVLTIRGAAFDDNTARNGGAIFNNGGVLKISDANFDGNSAHSYNGGAIYNDGGELTISDATFNANFANGAGGALYMDNNIQSPQGSFMFLDSSIVMTGNSAGSVGADIRVSPTGTTLTCTSSCSTNEFAPSCSLADQGGVGADCPIACGACTGMTCPAGTASTLIGITSLDTTVPSGACDLGART